MNSQLDKPSSSTLVKFLREQAAALSDPEDWHGPGVGVPSGRMEWQAADLIESLLAPSSLACNEIIEQCALVVDQCNREGPYNAIGAASRIRALKTVSYTSAATERIEPQNLRLKRELDEALAQRDYWKRTAESVPSAIACNELPKGFVSLDDYIAELEKDPAQKALLDNARAWVKANKESWIRDTPPTSGRSEAAARVSAALDILEKVSSTGGKGPLFSYRGTELTYDDLRTLCASSASGCRDFGQAARTLADDIEREGIKAVFDGMSMTDRQFYEGKIVYALRGQK